jgi:pyruvate, water dikinase
MFCVYPSLHEIDTMAREDKFAREFSRRLKPAAPFLIIIAVPLGLGRTSCDTLAKPSQSPILRLNFAVTVSSSARMSKATENECTVIERLDDHLRTRPNLSERIYRELMMELHRRGHATVDDIQDEGRRRMGLAEQTVRGDEDPNQAQRPRLDESERLRIEQVTRELVARHFTIADIDDLVNLTLKREEVHSLENVANRGDITFRELADKVQRFCQIPLGETLLQPAEVIGTRVALIRHFISDQLEFIGAAKNHLLIRDFDDVTRRMIGSDNGMGRIGGKAGGMLLAHSILAAAERDKSDVFLPVAMPESWYLRSDVIEEFLRLNRLDEYQSQKYKPIDDVAREYPLIRGVFRNGDFPLKVVHELRRVLEKIGNHPLIVRSSSLLEDRFGTAFCGKYASYFLANQGSLEHRLRSLLGAIAEVYASILAPDPILYRREHHLIDYVEGMAVLIQKVVGVTHGQYFLPLLAGVAFSRNEYRWAPRIKREDGLLRVVMGLGTRAVDRSGADYPRMVALSAPTLRPESNVQEILRAAQKTLDVIDTENNRLSQVHLADVLAQGGDFPMLDKLVSIHRDGDLFMPSTAMIDAEPSALCITFDKLIRETPFAQRVRDMLRRLEDVYRVPVDMEFATDGKKFYVLQCRTQSQALDAGPVKVPRNIPPEDVVFDAHRFVRTGLIEHIEYIVYVDDARYGNLETREKRIAVARAVGRLNHKLKPRSFILVGPGRWGSNDIRLGVPVRFADINNSRMLVEVARPQYGFSPEVSFGTHFFQDLVESNIHYLPLYPEEAGNRFKEEFFTKTPNILTDLAPDDADVADVLRVIHIPAVAHDRKLFIAMDGESDEALAYLK